MWREKKRNVDEEEEDDDVARTTARRIPDFLLLYFVLFDTDERQEQQQQKAWEQSVIRESSKNGKSWKIHYRLLIIVKAAYPEMTLESHVKNVFVKNPMIRVGEWAKKSSYPGVTIKMCKNVSSLVFEGSRKLAMRCGISRCLLSNFRKYVTTTISTFYRRPTINFAGYPLKQEISMLSSSHASPRFVIRSAWPTSSFVDGSEHFTFLFRSRETRRPLDEEKRDNRGFLDYR